MKILVIEDSRFLRLALERALVKAGHEVKTAGEGQGGIRAAQEISPDVIVLDMMLPNLDGTAVLRQIKDDPTTRHIPIVVLSGLSQKNEQRLKLAGAAAFIEKSGLDLEGNPQALIRLVNQFGCRTVEKCGQRTNSTPTGTGA